MSRKTEIVIIGSGPAGLTAAIYAARDGYKPIVLAGVEYGGQLMGTTDVENFPGFPEGVMGPELMQNMLKQAEKYGAEILYENVDEVDFSGDTKILKTAKEEYHSKTVIIATGATARRLDVDGEEEFWGKGVSTCATCDAAFYRGKTAAVIGGGDTAMEDANFLTRFADKVYVVHRRDEFRASKIMQDKTLENPKIEVIWNSEVKSVNGEENVKSLTLHNTVDDTESDLEVDGMFLAIGHIPNTSFLGNTLKTDDQGYIVVKEETQTSVKGVFVAGDVKDYRYQQAITAAGMGCMAALDAEKYLEEEF